MAFTFVQANGPSGVVASPNTMAYGSANAVGNLLVAAVILTNAETFTSLTDSSGNTWTQAGTFQAASTDNIGLFYVLDCKAGSNTVSLAFTGGSASILGVTEFSPGLGHVSRFDTTGFGTGTGTAVATNSFTPAGSGELIVAFTVGFSAVTWSAGSNFTLPTGWTNTTSSSGAEYNLTGASGAQTAAMTAGTSVTWGILAGAFITAVAGVDSGGGSSATFYNPIIQPVNF